MQQENPKVSKQIQQLTSRIQSLKQELSPGNIAELADTIYHLGAVYHNKAHKIYEACVTLNEAIKVCELFPGQKIERSAMFELALCYISWQKYKQSIDILEKLKQIYVKMKMAESKAMLSVVKNIAMCYEQIEDHAKSLQHFRKVVKISIKLEGNKSKTFVEYCKHIAKKYQQLQNYIKAQNYYIQSLSVWKQLYSVDKHFGSVCYFALARVRYRTKHYDKCLKDLEKSLELGMNLKDMVIVEMKEEAEEWLLGMAEMFGLGVVVYRHVLKLANQFWGSDELFKVRKMLKAKKIE